MQHLAGGDDPIDSLPVATLNPPIGITQVQLLWLLKSLAQQQQAAYLRWLHSQPS